jgi:hypothetical protein
MAPETMACGSDYGRALAAQGNGMQRLCGGSARGNARGKTAPDYPAMRLQCRA